MWDTTTFDNTNGGGGFMDGTINGFDSPGKKKEQVRRVQSVVPLVTRQILESPDEDLKLFGHPIQIANLVGILRNFEVQSTKATCSIEDHTGVIKGVLWLENDNDTVTSIPPVKDGSYVHIYGSIRNQDGEKIVMILKMAPISDLDVIVNHLLEVVHTRLAAEEMSKGPTASLKHDPSSSAMSYSDVNVHNTKNANSSGLSSVQDKVLQLLQACTEPVGMERDTVLTHFSHNQVKEVKDALEFLLDEGHAYTTIDNEHYKATNI